MTDKEIIYRTNVQRSLVEMYNRMEKMLEAIPEGIEEKDLTPEHEEIITRIDAIESEWIIDPEQRDSLSLINWQ